MAWTVTHSVYLDENPKMRRANAATEGRAELLLMWLLRMARRHGFGTVIPANYAAMADIAEHRRMPVDLVEQALAACTKEKILVQHEDGAVEILPDDHWLQPLSEAERKRNERERRKKPGESRDVTPVTQRHETSPTSGDTADSSHAMSRLSRSGSDPDHSGPKKQEEAAGAALPSQPNLIPEPEPEPTQKAEKGKSGQTKTQLPPLPFTVGSLCSELQTASGGVFVAEPFDQRLAKPITLTIRALMESGGVSLEDAKLAGAWLRAGGAGGFQVGPPWLASTGKLANAIGQARQWAARGRPPIVGGGGPRPPGPAPAATSVDDMRRQYEGDRR